MVENILYIIAVMLILTWGFGVIILGLTGMVHLLLILAMVAVILRIIQYKK